MKAKIILIIVGFTILSLQGCGLMSKKYLKTKSEEHQINTAGKTKVKLENVIGNISIIHSADSELLTVKVTKELKVKKKFLETPFDEIEIRIDSSGSILSISTEMNDKRDNSFFSFNPGKDSRVDYIITVPAGMKIEIENVSGNVTSDNLENDLDINLVNGDVDMDKFTGKLDCQIVNGSFSGHIDSTAGMEVNIINGSATVFLNNYMNATVRAETTNGKVTDENLKFSDAVKEKKMLKGTLGNPESNVNIKVETINGKIKLIGRNEI